MGRFATCGDDASRTANDLTAQIDRTLAYRASTRKAAAQRERRILTTIPADFPALRGLDWSASGVDVLDRARCSPAGLLRRLLRDASTHDAVLLNGSGRLDQIAATLLAQLRSVAPIVISDCTWQRGTWRLDRLAGRAGIRAIDSAQPIYCVLSSDEVRLFPRTWGVDASRVVFTPFCYTLTEEELAARTSTSGSVFSGGDSMRDFRPLLAAAKNLPVDVTLAVQQPPAPPGDLPPNVCAKAVSHAAFVELMRHARVVVVPLRAGIERSAGQQTYLNAMALGKLIITTDSPGARDYIEHGSTGLIVPAGDEDSLASALGWALDPSHEGDVAEIAARARAVVRSRFRPVDHFQCLLDVVDRAVTGWQAATPTQRVPPASLSGEGNRGKRDEGW